MPARHRPTTRRSASAWPNPTGASAKAALTAAPVTLAMAKMRLAEKRSARPETASSSVPAMKPTCTALVRWPKAAGDSDQARIRSSAALFGLNHSDVPKSCASTMVPTG